MLINKDIMEELKISSEVNSKNDTSKDSDFRVSINKVQYIDENNFTVEATVKYDDEGPEYNTLIYAKNGEVEDVTCTCAEYESTYGTCRHIMQSATAFNDSAKYSKLFSGDTSKKEEVVVANTEAYRIYRQLINSFYEEEDKKDKKIIIKAKEKVHLKCKLFYNSSSKDLKAEFEIGNKQFYKIRNLIDFYDKMQKGEKAKYGLKLELVHVKEAFEETDLPLLNFLIKYSEIIKYANESANRYYQNMLNNSYIVLSHSAMDELFETLSGKTVECEMDGEALNVNFVDKEPNVKFEIINKSDYEYALATKEDVYEYTTIEGKDFIYFLKGKNLFKCSEKFKNTTLTLLDAFRINMTNEIPFRKTEFASFYSLMLPNLTDSVSLDKLDQDELENYKPKALKVKVYLDYTKSGIITADVKFDYDNNEFSPFEKVDESIPRNAIEESKALDLFSKCGFVLDTKNNRLMLVDDEKIYEFLKGEIEEFISRFEILATDDFRQKQITSPKVNSIGIKIENNLLSIDLSGIDFNSEEITEIMKKYKMKRKFHRLKNGDFIDLSKNDTLEVLQKLSEGTNIDFKNLASGNIKLPIYRSLYLDKILEKTDIVVKQEEKYKDLINDVYSRQISDKFKLPEGLNATLREYQEVGFDWLKTIDMYGLGGILADDMGLGKTVQILAVILSYIQETPKSKRRPTIVVCPSSLILNWKEESEKFTPSLRTLSISGNIENREKLINSIKNYDLVITSYDLLKRDIDIYKKVGYRFRYIVADEAQYIKNNNTQNAKAIKEIEADTKYALTGTPIENSLAELWSIFDFIMPGYLFSYNKFKINYESPIAKDSDPDAMSKLKNMIEPFILRRIKEKVLTELPDKTISVLNNEMNDEQLKLYLSYLKVAKKEVKEEIEVNGIANSQIKILALLMRLRQICCHPGLFIDNFKGESSKLTQCTEIINDAVQGGHKILLFSGYSSMFWYIEKELDRLGISYLKLTGQTKVNQRMNLVNRFNNDESVKVFLISLKAGGTGLNLIGADMVIHYDPWWNLSAENQATDRTYRIGQKRNVQVYKLITKNSIEEKIYNLQERKARLANNMLSTKETFISKLSKDEIMDLFE